MKKNLFLLFVGLVLSALCHAQDFKDYKVYPGENYCTPKVTGSVTNELEFCFKLDHSWDQLYLNEELNTQKIAGVGDVNWLSSIFTFKNKNNSLRLGVHRFEKLREGLCAVAYYHKNGKEYWPAMKDQNNKNLCLSYNRTYYCKIYEATGLWKIDLRLYPEMKLISSYSASIAMNNSRKRQGMYVEPGIIPFTSSIITQIAFLN